MLLNLTDLSSEPLHGQISRQIRAQILAGDLAAGEPLPSIRTLARDQRVSVITVQRAYEDLQRSGLIIARRGKGFSTCELSSEQRLQLATQRLSEMLQPIVAEACAEGLDEKQIREVFNSTIDNTGMKR